MSWFTVLLIGSGLCFLTLIGLFIWVIYSVAQLESNFDDEQVN